MNTLTRRQAPTTRHDRRSGGHRTTLALGIALPVLGLALVSCSASPGSSSAPGTAAGAPAATTGPGGGDACRLLTDIEAEGFLGGSVTREGPVSRNRGQVCSWTNAATGSVMSVQLFSGRAFYAPDVQAPGAAQVRGIGDEAFVSDAIAGARKGDTVVFVDAVGPGAGTHLEAALRTAATRA